MEVAWVPEVSRDEWDDLWLRAEGATPFQTWSWHEAFRTSFGGRPNIAVWREEGRIIGLHSYRFSYGIARPFVWGPTDDLRPLFEPGEGPAFFMMTNELAKQAVWGLDQGETDRFPGTPTKPRPISEEAPLDLKEHSIRLLLDLPSSFDEYVASLSKSLRTDVRRALRDEANQIRRGTVEDLGILFDLHGARWRKRGLPGVFGRRVREFHRALWTLDPELPELWILEREEKPVGALYAFRGRETTYFYQSGFDPTASKFSPGTALVAHAIKTAIERGDKVFDFCRGDEPYKRRWNPTREVRQYRHVIPYNGLGRMRARWIWRAHLWEQRLKARFEGGTLWKR